jgi:hypothetical protein
MAETVAQVQTGNRVLLDWLSRRGQVEESSLAHSQLHRNCENRIDLIPP